ncbi:histidine phosphatase family protein [Minwuia thermotolerans]|uniref:Histidine phosphatase family protein n=1 Tax=Minwuia thermotolerans TaxID=2056226 RepID=A0A2M9FY41_9PROT|nr:histidine phosphatase family protein [Minwuia thermotolerans]PJK28378.1 histidine phosphatase family protein [Minwuia thermotolerans]
MFTRLLLALALFAVAGAAGGQLRADEAAWAALAKPGAIAIMRHTIAPGYGDPADFEIGDCATQRNLDAEGRDQARAIGAAVRDRGIEFARVLTSQWCRCRDTARLLGLGEPEDFPALNSFFRDRSTRSARTAEVRDLLHAHDGGERLMLVTHQVNISALTGRGVASGELLVLDVAEDGSVRVAGSILMRP